MDFQYLKTETYMDSIDIEDPGNCYITVMNDDAKEWYLRTSTSLGWCDMQVFGPLTVDDDSLGYSFSLRYNRFEYNGKKVYKLINDFINDPKKTVTQAFVIEQDDYDNRLGDVIKALSIKL